jgi:aquaporin Z
MKKLLAEFIGTLWLVPGGYGSAVLAAGYPEPGIGFAGIAIAFGLTVLTMVYAVGHISGGHFNPAVSIGLWAGGRFDKKELLPCISAQVLDGIAGAPHPKAPKGFAGLAIGIALPLIHLISIPVTNTSVNPERSTSQALLMGNRPISQLWLFWVAPPIGAWLAGLGYQLLSPIVKE